MTDPSQSARDDLAFVRALVSEGGQVQASAGEALLAGGLCYGLQCLVQWALMVSGWPAPPIVHLTAGFLPTVIFVALIIWIVRRNGAVAPQGMAMRAFNAGFGSTGLATLTTAAIFGYLAWRRQDMGVWLFHPLMVAVLQGAAWYIAFAIRRRGWLALVSVGWFATAILGALMLERIDLFILLIGAALLLLMALPGWILLRGAANS
ncbi:MULTISPECIES: hypothetical protein [unclassified Sphingomonas]|uniref:hypothetical protein n=1 Tax=unclassified Sphingomonas TaxID=196159 RepID=UPI00082A7896|nr:MULTISPECIES: hypothetical protein [unclassified Sphingomonas]